MIRPENVNLTKRVYFCVQCAKAFEFTTAEGSVECAPHVPKPAGSTVEFAADEETLGLIIRNGNHSALRRNVVAIAVVLNVVAAGAAIGALLPQRSIDVSGVGASALVLFALLAGLVALFFARGEFTLGVNRRECVAIWSLYRWNITRRAATAGITDVVEQEVYNNNGRRRFAVRIKHPRGNILFGVTLSDAERQWVISELRRYLRQLTGSAVRSG